jgi:hypothetical protein
VAGRRLLALVTLVVTGAVGLAACGDGDEPTGPRLSRAEYVAAVETRCDELGSSRDPVAIAQAANETGEVVRRAFATRARTLRELGGVLDGLVPPATLADDAERLAELLGRYAEGLDELAAAVEPGQGVLDVLDANAALVQRLNDTASRASQTAADLGLLGCIAVG